MTKNGYFCGILALLFGLGGFLTAAAGSNSQTWLGAWFIIVSVMCLFGAVISAFVAIADYLSENEE